MTETMVRIPRPFNRTTPSRRSGYVSMRDDEKHNTTVAVRTLACGEVNENIDNARTIQASSVKKLATGTIKNNKRQQHPSHVIVNFSKATTNSNLALTSRDPTFCNFSDGSTESADSFVLGLKSFSISESEDGCNEEPSLATPRCQPQQEEDGNADTPSSTEFPAADGPPQHPSKSHDNFLKAAKETIRTARETVSMTSRKGNKTAGGLFSGTIKPKTVESMPMQIIHVSTTETENNDDTDDDCEQEVTPQNIAASPEARPASNGEKRRCDPQPEVEKMHIPTGITFKKVTLVSEGSKKALSEQVFWTAQVKTRTTNFGSVHPHTAEAFYNLGHAYMRCVDYPEAIRSFKSSCRIWRFLKGSNHLAVAKALDSVGLAALKAPKTESNLREANKAVHQAFQIRNDHLGPWHVDTVESYNKVASLYLHMRQYSKACKAYEEVYLVRKAIFGDGHPSVAIAAHSLANVYLKLSDTEQCFQYYNVALDIYNKMNLKSNHPTVARLLRDRKRLDRCLVALVNA